MRATSHNFGLQQVYPPVGSKDVTTIDIIAIHGLDASAPQTWEYRYDERDGEKVVNWLSDIAMLPVAVPNARIFTYNWHAEFFKDAVDLTLSNHAEGLLLDIRVLREEELDPANRPIVFIASCFGGIVLAKALNSAAGQGSSYSFVRRVTVGVVFLGTPFKGTAAHTKAQWLTTYSDFRGEKTSFALIKDLDRSTGVLDDIIQEFARSSKTKDYYLPIYCFFETIPTNLSKKVLPKPLAKYLRLDEFLVDQDSACLLGSESNSLDCPHVMMNKFAPNTQNFLRVKSAVFNLVRDAEDILARRKSGQLSSISNQYLEALRQTDPRLDMKRIIDNKDALLKDSYKWILDHPDFIAWRNSDETRLLWIKGDPGKGKTMLLIGIIEELSQELEPMPEPSPLSYFFCQGTDSRLNNVTAVLRGLIYLLLIQQISLIAHLREKFDHAGRQLFEDANAFYALSEIFRDMLHDPTLTRVYLILDALDECETGLTQLLDLIVRNVSASSRVKWIVSSRNRHDIEARLQLNDSHTNLSLELNAEHVSHAVDVYIDHKVSQLTRLKHYDSMLQDQVRDLLCQKANGTFLWVALVCKELGEVEIWNTLEVLDEVPADLTPLYDRMMKQILQLERKDPEFCRLILSTTTLAYRPLHLLELGALAGLPEQLSCKLQSLITIINMCGSFLTIRKDTVYFIHQSAKDYIDSNIFPSGKAEVHRRIVSKSLQVMSKTLRRDIYDLRAPGTLITQVVPVEQDPLAPVRYSCVSWIDHLCELDSSSHYQDELRDGGAIHIFLQEHFLHWLEALSLLGSMPNGVLAIAKLENLLRAKSNMNSKFLALIRDANRFVLSNRWVVETAPLQAYASALIFSPAYSLIRELFRKEEPRWITTKPAMESNWSLCLQALEGHTDRVRSVAFSHDGHRLASASDDNTVRLWDSETGALLQTLEGHTARVNSVTFSHDGRRLASASDDKTVRTWDGETGAPLQTLEGHIAWVNSVTFSHDGLQLASASDDKTVRVWDGETDVLLQTLEGHMGRVSSVAFSQDGCRLASASYDRTVRMWDSETGTPLQTLEGHTHLVSSVAFSHDGHRLASASYDKTVRMWDSETGALLQTLEGHTHWVRSVAFSHDGRRLASASSDKTVRVWDGETGALLQTLEGHTGGVCSVTFSHDGHRLASASGDNIVRVWDGETGTPLQTLEGHIAWVSSVAFSHDGLQLVSASDNIVQMWDSETGAPLQTLEGHTDLVNSVTFSHDGRRLASASYDKTVRVWNSETGALLQTLEGHTDWVNSVTFSHDGHRLASVSGDNTVRVWDGKTGALLQTLEGHTAWVNSVTFSQNGHRLASASEDNTVRVWDGKTGVLLQTLEGHMNGVRSVAFSHDGLRLASASYDRTVRMWDGKTGALLQTIEIDTSLRELSFNSQDSHLVTDIGSIILDLLSSHTIQELNWSGYGIRSDRSWITWHGRNILWLPPEYRSFMSTVRETSIAIGCYSGRVILINFSSIVHPVS